jgi:Spy/CpxP family protein refolding chaperone
MIRRAAIIAGLLAVVGGGVAFRAMSQGDSGSRFSDSTGQFLAQGAPDRMRDLNLSPDQMQRIRTIRQQYKDRLRIDREAARVAQEALRSAMASNLPRDRVEEKFRQAQTAREKAATTQFESMLAMREVLTLEQRQKVAERMGRRGDRKMSPRS